MKTKNLSLSVISFAVCFTGQSIFANPNHIDTSLIQNLTAFNARPRVELGGFVGSKMFVEGQTRMPIYGDQESAWYLLVEGSAEKHNAFMAGGGVGYRAIFGDAIYGGYGALDYTKTTEKNDFWVASPGFERFGSEWDFAASAYIPTKGKAQVKENWASKFGVNDYIKRFDHEASDRKMRLYEEAAKGVDFDVGHAIPYLEKAKGYFGGYYFHSDFGSMRGVEARVTYDLNRYFSAEIRDSFDNKNHNRFACGIKLNLGNYSANEKEAFGLSSRLYDPIDRNIAILPASNEVTIFEGRIAADHNALMRDGLWYFLPLTQEDRGDAVVGDGTFEHPFHGFTPESFAYTKAHYNDFVHSIDPYPLMYFAPGTYSLADFKCLRQNPVTAEVELKGRFDLPNGWGMYGRDNNGDPTDPFKVSANGDRRAKFVGGIDLYYPGSGNNTAKTTLESIQIYNDKKSIGVAAGINNNAAVFLENVVGDGAVLQNVNISNAVVGVGIGVDTDDRVFGVFTKDSVLEINGSFINSSATGGDASNVLSGIYELTADGLYVASGSVSAGDGNVIKSIARGGTMQGVFGSSGQGINDHVNAEGIVVSSGVVNVGNGNLIEGITYGATVNVTGSGSVSGAASATSHGIHVLGGAVSIGSANTISAQAVGGGATVTTTGVALDADAGALSNAYGVEVSSGTATILGSYNTFGTAENEVKAIGGAYSKHWAGGGTNSGTSDGKAYALCASGYGIINFGLGAFENKITVNGSTHSYGIYAASDFSHLQNNGGDVDDLASLLSHFSIITRNGIGGEKVQWWSKQGVANNPLHW